MESIAMASQSLSSFSKFSNQSSICSTSKSNPSFPSFFRPKTSFPAHQSAQNLGFIALQLQCCRIIPSPKRNLAVVCASDEEIANAPADVAQGWLLEPVGDGDWKHIGYKVEKPGAFEVFSSVSTIGRVPEKVDLVIPVATVSGVHARIENKEGNLFITDLDSTNGTYINEKRVAPGATAPVPPGSLLTFGDTHLAIFRVSKLQKAILEEKSYSEEGAAQPETAS